MLTQSATTSATQTTAETDPPRLSSYSIADMVHVCRSLTPLTLEQERTAVTALVHTYAEPDPDGATVRERDGRTYLSCYYGPGRSVRIIAHEHRNGPVRTGLTVPAAEVSIETLTSAQQQVLHDARAILTARGH